MTTTQSLAAGTLAAALLSAIPLGWQTHQLNQRATAAARSSDAEPVSSAPTSPESADGSSPPAAGTAKPAEPPSDDVLEELGKEMEGEMMEVMRNWAMSAAWTESRGLAMALGLSPERESALRAALEEYQGNRVAGVMDGGTKAGTERRKFKEQRDTWLAENLSPEEFTKLKALDASQRENMIASKAEEALHWITSKVELTEDQKTKLFNTAAERAGADFDKDEYGGMMQFMGTFQSTPASPVEDAAAEFVAGVLDAEQQQLWEESASRTKYATEDMPRRLVDSAFAIVKKRGLLGVMAAMMKEMTPPAAPTAEPNEAP